MDHVDHLFLVVTDLVRAVIGHDGQGRADHAIDFPGFAPAVALAVEGGEISHQICGELHFAAEKDPAPGNKNIMKNHGRRVLGIVPVSAVTTVLFPRIQARPADDVNHARRVARHGKGDRKFLLALAQGPGRQDDDFVSR